MANQSSLLASYSLGVQADKETQATSLVTGLKTRSNVPGPAFDTYEPGAEHPGPTTRNTLRRSPTERTGYLAPFGSTGLLYPRLFPIQLIGAGFNISTSDEGTYYTHTANIALADALQYLTCVYSATDETWLRAITGGRITSLQVTADPQNEITVTDEGQGLVIGAVSGTPTYQDEEPVRIKSTAGTAQMNVNGVDLSNIPIRGFTWNVAQALDDQDFQLFVASRADLPQQSIDITGEVQELDLLRDQYQLIQNAGVGNTDPSLIAATGNLGFQFESAANISGAAVPYSVNFVIGSCEFTMSEFPADGENLMRYALTYQLLDAPGGPAQPAQVVIVNDVPSY
jgi:hypothetical protein